MIPDEGTRYLKVRASTAGDVIPVEGAVVYVRSLGAGDDRLVFSLRTDASGQTRTAALPAPTAAAEGALPDEEPVRSYGVEIMKEGYRTVEYAGVPIYAGITTLIEAKLSYPLGDFVQSQIKTCDVIHFLRFLSCEKQLCLCIPTCQLSDPSTRADALAQDDTVLHYIVILSGVSACVASRIKFS